MYTCKVLWFVASTINHYRHIAHVDNEDYRLFPFYGHQYFVADVTLRDKLFLKSRRDPNTFNDKEINELLKDWFSNHLDLDKSKLSREAKLIL